MPTTQYELALLAMKRLLNAVGESHWSQWIEQDINDWRAKQDSAHHRSAYGGMGSFNDVWICRANNHTVTETEEPWANTLFEWLKSVCYFLAKHPSVTFEAHRLAQRIGRHDAALSAFVGGDSVPDSMRGYVDQDRKLQGWRCLACGHGEASGRDIDNLIAQHVVPNLLFDGCERFSLDELVDQILACSIPNLKSIREALVSAMKSTGIALTNRDGWMRPCPECGTDDTAVYRWRLIVEGGLRLEPSDDNLSMRK